MPQQAVEPTKAQPATPTVAPVGYQEVLAVPVEQELSGPHPIEYYVQTALQRNPEIVAARHRVAAEAQTVPQVTALDDPMLMDTFWPISDHSLQTAAGRLPNTLSFSQRFPWYSKLRIRGEIAQQETQIALTQLAQTQLEVAEQVKLAYFELYYNQTAIGITEDSEQLLETLVQIAEARYRTGGSQQDVLRAQLELDKLRDRLIGLRRQLRISQADLAALLHASPDAEPRAADAVDLGEVPQTINLLYEAAVQCRPELQERLHAIIRDHRRRELACLQYYPDVTLGVGWSAVTTDDAVSRNGTGNDNLNFVIGVNLPIWRDKLRAGVHEAEHRVAEGSRRYDAACDETFRIIRRLIAQADAHRQQLELYRKRILPRARQTLEISTADYRVGKVGFLQIIDNWTELLAFQIQIARLEANLGQTLASLERVIGCQLAEIQPIETSEEQILPVPALQPVHDGSGDGQQTS